MLTTGLRYAPPIVTKKSPCGPKVGPKKIPEGCPKVFLQLSKGCLQDVPKWSPSCLKYVSIFSQSCLKIVFFVQFFIWHRSLVDQLLICQSHLPFVFHLMTATMQETQSSEQTTPKSFCFLTQNCLQVGSKLSQGCHKVLSNLSQGCL